VQGYSDTWVKRLESVNAGERRKRRLWEAVIHIAIARMESVPSKDGV